MSWRKAADLAGNWVARFRAEALQHEHARERYTKQRLADEFEAFQAACMKRSAIEDVTAVEPKRS